jgi:hypothetical protein
MEKITKLVPCDRCSGRGWFAVGCHNGQLVPAMPDGAVCYKCGGTKTMEVTEIVRTEKEQLAYEKAKARREAKRQEAWAAKQAEAEARAQAKLEAEAKREAERLAKCHKGFVGQPGDKLKLAVTCLFKGQYDKPAYMPTWSHKVDTVYVYGFETEDKHLLIWKTTSYQDDFAPGLHFNLTGTVKEHTTYRDEDQTIITRAKLGRMEI